MMTLKELDERTGEIFGANNTIPQPEIVWQRKLDALEAAGLHKERAAAIFEMRCTQASEMGFLKVTIAELVKEITGDSHTHSDTNAERQNHEWFYNHHNDDLITDPSKSWGGKPNDYKFMWRKNGWWLPPFTKVAKWNIRLGKIGYVKRQMPHDLALRVHDLKKLKIFNVFNYLGPVESYEKDTEMKGVVLGAVWEIPPDAEGKYGTSGICQYYYIGTWK